MERTRNDIDVVHVTTANPYKELNFIGTYAAITFSTCAAFSGFVMPITSLAQINAIIGRIALLLEYSKYLTDNRAGPSDNMTWVALAW